jgi:hypothetical protein
MWTRQELERQRVLDALAVKTGNADDWDTACIHFNSVERRLDKKRPVDAYADLMVEIVATAAEAYHQAGDKNIKFERRRVDETAHKRWSRATDAREFFRSQTFVEMMQIFGMEPSKVFDRIHHRLA